MEEHRRTASGSALSEQTSTILAGSWLDTPPKNPAQSAALQKKAPSVNIPSAESKDPSEKDSKQDKGKGKERIDLVIDPVMSTSKSSKALTSPPLEPMTDVTPAIQRIRQTRENILERYPHNLTDDVRSRLLQLDEWEQEEIRKVKEEKLADMMKQEELEFDRQIRERYAASGIQNSAQLFESSMQKVERMFAKLSTNLNQTNEHVKSLADRVEQIEFRSRAGSRQSQSHPSRTIEPEILQSVHQQSYFRPGDPVYPFRYPTARAPPTFPPQIAPPTPVWHTRPKMSPQYHHRPTQPIAERFNISNSRDQYPNEQFRHRMAQTNPQNRPEIQANAPQDLIPTPNPPNPPEEESDAPILQGSFYKLNQQVLGT